MVKVSCSACGQKVEIAPDSALCSACGKDLIALLPVEGTPQDYYARAEKFVDEGNLEAALQIVQDGLETVISSDLLLLGAILSEKAAQYDLMRHYVSRIPVDDSLRVEGEWLLRAHQARQRAQRQGKDPSQAVLEEMSETFGLPPEADYEDLDERDLRISEDMEASSPQRRIAPALLSLLIFAGLFGMGWFYRDELLSQAWVPAALQTVPEVGAASPDDLPSGTSSDGTQNDSASYSAGNGGVNNEEVNSNETNSDEIGQSATDGTLPAQPSGEADSPSLDQSAVSTSVPMPTIGADVLLRQYETPSAPETDEVEPGDTSPAEPTPDESIPNDLTENATPEPIADADPQTVVDVVGQAPFDVLRYLRDSGYPALADLPVDAQAQDGKLIVTGVVKWYEEREDIIAALQFAPDVSEVNAIGLKIRTPETYIVQEADTLWIIAYRIYGDGARWPQIYELNQDTLLSPDTLGLGQVLKLPPQ